MNPSWSPCVTSCRWVASSVVLRGIHNYTTRVANTNSCLNEIRSDGYEALKLRSKRLSLRRCCPGDLSRKRSTLRESLPGRCFRFVASQLTFRRQLLGGLAIEGHQLNQLAFKIFSKRDIGGLQVLA